MQTFIALAKAASVKLCAGFVNSQLMPDADELTPCRHPDAIANGVMSLGQPKAAGRRFRTAAVDGRVAGYRASIRRRGMDHTSDGPRISDGLPMAGALRWSPRFCSRQTKSFGIMCVPLRPVVNRPK